MTVGLSASSHASTTCCGETPCASAAAPDRRDVRRPVRLADPAERRPGQERDPALLRRAATSPLPIGDVKSSASWFCTLTTSTIASRLLELLDARVGDADPAHLARVLELLERADRLGVGHVRIGPVELVEVDHVGLERAQRRLARGADVLRPAVERPRAAARAGVAALGGDEHAVAAAAQRLGDQPLVVADLVPSQAVRVGGVDQVHAGVERRVDRADRPVLVGAAARARAASRRGRSGRPRRRRACGSGSCRRPYPKRTSSGRHVVAQPLVGGLAQRPGAACAR